jgi:hypothetical protein
VTAQYNIVHFVPDPFAGARLPVAALVDTERGVAVVRNQSLPTVKCIGHQARKALQLVFDALDDIKERDSLPIEVGPQAILDAPRHLPTGITDPVAWLQKNVLSPRKELHRKTQRSTQGQQFFEQAGVGSYIRTKFQPSDIWDTPLGLPPISLWAGSKNAGLLLLEPLVPKNGEVNGQVEAVGTRFSAYRFHLQRFDSYPKQMTELVAYLLPGPSNSDRDHAITALKQSAHRVYDTALDNQREELVDKVRDIGERALALKQA